MPDHFYTQGSHTRRTRRIGVDKWTVLNFKEAGHFTHNCVKTALWPEEDNSPCFVIETWDKEFYVTKHEASYLSSAMKTLLGPFKSRKAAMLAYILMDKDQENE